MPSLSGEALLQLWAHADAYVAEAVLEGIVRVKRCTLEGRAAMSVDLQGVGRALVALMPRGAPPPNLRLVDNYVKVRLRHARMVCAFVFFWGGLTLICFGWAGMSRCTRPALGGSLVTLRSSLACLGARCSLFLDFLFGGQLCRGMLGPCRCLGQMPTVHWLGAFTLVTHATEHRLRCCVWEAGKEGPARLPYDIYNETLPLLRLLVTLILTLRRWPQWSPPKQFVLPTDKIAPRFLFLASGF